LAIGGVIISIVFLAFPALQRNSQNNQRAQDVSTVLASISSYRLNNSGNLPDQLALNDRVDNLKITFYEPDSISIVGVLSGAAPPNNGTNLEQVVIQNRSKCNASANGQPTGSGAGYSDVVALYSIQTGSGSAIKCKEL